MGLSNSLGTTRIINLIRSESPYPAITNLNLEPGGTRKRIPNPSINSGSTFKRAATFMPGFTVLIVTIPMEDPVDPNSSRLTITILSVSLATTKTRDLQTHGPSEFIPNTTMLQKPEEPVDVPPVIWSKRLLQLKLEISTPTSLESSDHG